ncbi:hypothetical protein M9H77_14185 [Catharanthus roseus]|uniref:Uncharacterized protein n=1 Tax=Catharanthus roseus TaxID=4058 RepID=A0ACC0BMF6_CATRO|nr:hypothetical protein M9H77_14185 [Catharanthus roseus]
MGRYRIRSRSRSRSYSPLRLKHYDDPRDRRRRQRRSSPSAPTGLLVRNISLSARTEDLRIPFERFGPIKDVYLPKNYYTGEPRGFGFVKFQFSEDAAEAKAQLNHTVIGGREIRIVFAEENRKTPQQMRRLTRVSNQGSYRRGSPSRSPRRRYPSYSRSPPARHDSRDRCARDAYYSPRRYRSASPSPKGDPDPFLGHFLPMMKKNERLRHPHPSPGEDDRRVHDDDYLHARDEDYMPRRSPTPRGKSHSPSRSRSRSYRCSPRR